MTKKELDQLSKDMIQCQKDGYGVHYGQWKAAQKPVTIVKKQETLAPGWKFCIRCQKPFKGTPNQKYCDIYCQTRSAREKAKQRQKDKRSAEG